MKLMTLIFGVAAALALSNAQARPYDNEATQTKLEICGAIYYDYFNYGDAFSRKHCLDNVSIEAAGDSQGRDVFTAWGSLEDDETSPKFNCTVVVEKPAVGQISARVESCVEQ